MSEIPVDVDSPSLSNDELGWLLGLAAGRRRKREEKLARMRRKPGQDADEFVMAVKRMDDSLNWSRAVEDHLIVLLGDRDLASLGSRHQLRYLELQDRP